MEEELVQEERQHQHKEKVAAVAGGGYPAAGIGRRWSWRPELETQLMLAEGTLLDGGEAGSEGGINGLSGEAIAYWSSGGSYYENGKNGQQKSKYGIIGGTGANSGTYIGGDGGTGGSGGIVYIENDLSRIHAYNGAYITEVEAIAQTDSWKQENQSIIYAQVGYSLVDLRADTETVTITYSSSSFEADVPVVSSISARTASALITELGTSYRSIDYSVYTTYGAMGIGSGGGCIEVSNGTLTVE